MIFALIPREPFTPINASSNVQVLPIRGCTKSLNLASRFSGVSIEMLECMDIGDEMEARNNSVIRRIK
jgi:hypothetical protein